MQAKPAIITGTRCNLVPTLQNKPAEAQPQPNMGTKFFFRRIFKPKFVGAKIVSLQK